ncbi:hypothetical protein OIPHN330_16710 [Citrobacter freundii]|nr:hypothetical protein OIPHN330_16710 [Citrobacter freundii]
MLHALDKIITEPCKMAGVRRQRLQEKHNALWQKSQTNLILQKLLLWDWLVHLLEHTPQDT